MISDPGPFIAWPPRLDDRDARSRQSLAELASLSPRPEPTAKPANRRTLQKPRQRDLCSILRGPR